MKRISQITAIAAVLAVTALVADFSVQSANAQLTIGGSGEYQRPYPTGGSVSIYDACKNPTSFWLDSSYTVWAHGPICSLSYWGNAWNYRTWHYYNRTTGYFNSLDCKSALGVAETCYWRYR